MLRSREDLAQEGVGDRRVRELVSRGILIRVRRGHFVPATHWARLWPEGRHLLHVLAVVRDADRPPVLSHESAAVVHAFPLYRHVPQRVHVIVPSPRHAGSASDLLRHQLELDDADVVEVGGLRVTSPERTAFDLALTMATDPAQCVADSALRAAAVDGHRQDAGRAEDWRARMGDRLERARGVPGVRNARGVIAFADGRAQLPGETVSRLHLRRVGFQEVDLQVAVPGPTGRDYFIDFGLDEIRAFGEFDGLGKYVDIELRAGMTATDVVVAEKRREDWIRGRTGRPFMRWEDQHIRTVRTFAARLQAFGVRFSGDLRLIRPRAF